MAERSASIISTTQPTSDALVADSSLPMVQVSQVSRSFGDTRAVDDISFNLPSGAFLTILGASGSGKTTLLRIIAGFLKPDAGEIYIKGEPLSKVPVYRRSIGMVFQRLALFPHMSAAQNVAYPLKMRRFDPAEIPARVEKYLGLVRLEGLGERRPHELSGGQQQRVAIARALVFEPDLLLLDEPLAALDRKLREEMQLEFRRIQRELGVTTINVTHDQREALVMSDEIMVMEQGAMQQLASPMATYREPANRYVAGFIGVTNFLAGEIIQALDGEARVRVAGLELRGRCLESGVSGFADCALRAEQLRLAASGETLGDVAVRLEGTIQEVIFEGDRLVYAIHCPALDGALLRAFDHHPHQHRAFQSGETVQLGWNHRDLLIYPR